MEAYLQKYFIYNGELKSTEDFNLKGVGTKIYEVIRIIDKIPLFLEEHIERLEKSLDIVNLKSRYDVEAINKYIKKLIEANQGAEGNIKLIMNFNENREDIYLFYIPHSYPKSELYEEGVATILYHGERENPNAKIINSSLRDSVNHELKKAEAYEAILIDNQGRVTEGSRSNIFFVKDEKLITSPIEAVLPGITRQQIIKLCTANDIKVEEKYINEQEIKECDALFISGTSPEVLPIKSVNLIKFASSCNSVVKKVMTLYDNSIEEYISKGK
ncbi:aminotransferase class IV [Clostridium polynesiense]|uniref:aminotransferase class IV n=1 Tax=Clostridium polynesiense TaxID=1325933 RepID=UPI00058B95A7|nr:aminotransferase class IV [Clostridium polynesiense]